MVDCVRRMVNEGMEVSLVNEPQLFVRKLQKEVPRKKNQRTHVRARARTHTQHARSARAHTHSTLARAHPRTHPPTHAYAHSLTNIHTRVRVRTNE